MQALGKAAICIEGAETGGNRHLPDMMLGEQASHINFVPGFERIEDRERGGNEDSYL